MLIKKSKRIFEAVFVDLNTIAHLTNILDDSYFSSIRYFDSIIFTKDLTQYIFKSEIKIDIELFLYGQTSGLVASDFFLVNYFVPASEIFLVKNIKSNVKLGSNTFNFWETKNMPIIPISSLSLVSQDAPADDINLGNASLIGLTSGIIIYQNLS